MFTRLLASAAPRQRSSFSVAVSVTAHLAVGAAAIVLTAAHPLVAKAPDPRIVYVDPPAAPTAPREAAPRGDAAHAGPRPAPMTPGPPVLSMLVGVTVPVGLPDVSVPLASPGDAWPRTAGTRAGASTGLGSGGGAEVLDANTVEFPVELLPGAPVPRYPELLRAAGVEGRVRVRFVVDTLGAVEPGSVTIVEATNPLFATSVREALLRQRFRAAQLGGHRVRQLVEEPFEFSVRR